MRAISRAACILVCVILHAACILACSPACSVHLGVCGPACGSVQCSVHPNTATQQPARALQQIGWVLQLVEILGRVDNMEMNKAAKGSESGDFAACSGPTGVSLIPSRDAVSLHEQLPCSCASFANTNQDSAAVWQPVLQDLSLGGSKHHSKGNRVLQCWVVPASEAGDLVPLTVDSNLMAQVGSSCAVISRSDGVTAHSITA